jgi:hypothetical protein
MMVNCILPERVLVKRGKLGAGFRRIKKGYGK